MGGGNNWNKIKHALGLSNLCAFIPSGDLSLDDDDDDSSRIPDSSSVSVSSAVTTKPGSEHSGPLMPRNSSRRSLLSNNSSRSSKVRIWGFFFLFAIFLRFLLNCC